MLKRTILYSHKIYDHAKFTFKNIIWYIYITYIFFNCTQEHKILITSRHGLTHDINNT